MRIFVEKVIEIIQYDRRHTCEDLAQELDLSNRYVYLIIRNRLGMRKVSARWVPQYLTSDQVQRRLNDATTLLSQYETEEKKLFLESLPWTRLGLDHMRQVTEWHTPNSPRPAKNRREQRNLKMLMIQYTLNGSNTDGSFTVDDSNSFFSPYKILHVAQENKYLGIFSYFIMELYVVCTH